MIAPFWPDNTLDWLVGFCIYRVRVRRGGRKRPVPKGCTYGKPVTHGVNSLKPTRNLQAVAEERVGRRCGGLRVLNSYWVGQDSTYKFYEVIMVDIAHKVIISFAVVKGLKSYDDLPMHHSEEDLRRKRKPLFLRHDCADASGVWPWELALNSCHCFCRPSATTLRRTGSATRCTSTASCAVWPRRRRSRAVWARATVTARLREVRDALAGRGATRCRSCASVKHADDFVPQDERRALFVDETNTCCRCLEKKQTLMFFWERAAY